MDLRSLTDERVKLYEDNKAVLDAAAKEKRTLKAEEQEAFDKREARMSEIKETLDRAAKLEAQEKLLAESCGRQTETAVVTEPTTERSAADIAKDQALAFRGWALGKRATAEQRAAAQRVGMDLSTSEIEVRALSVGTTDAGGYSVPDELMRSFYEIQKYYSSVRNVATVIKTGSGAALPIPTVTDTSNTGEIISEAGAVTTTADPTFGQVVLDAYKYSSKAVIVSVELLQDCSISLPQYLGNALGTRIGRIQNTHFTTGDGSSKPNGIVTASTVGKTAASTSAFTWDEVIELIHSVDVAYRAKAGVMLHDTIAGYLRRLKDGNGRYLWEMSTQVGVPDRVLGYPVTINNDMDSALTTGKKLMLFGDFATYVVRDAGGPVFARADELRILNHQVVFLAFQRSDGDLLDTTAVKHLKLA